MKHEEEKSSKRKYSNALNQWGGGKAKVMQNGCRCKGWVALLALDWFPGARLFLLQNLLGLSRPSPSYSCVWHVSAVKYFGATRRCKWFRRRQVLKARLPGAFTLPLTWQDIYGLDNLNLKRQDIYGLDNLKIYFFCFWTNFYTCNWWWVLLMESYCIWQQYWMKVLSFGYLAALKGPFTIWGLSNGNTNELGKSKGLSIWAWFGKWERGI